MFALAPQEGVRPGALARQPRTSTRRADRYRLFVGRLGYLRSRKPSLV